MDGDDDDDGDDDRFSISLDECGDTKGCFRLPTGCEADDCDMAVAWTPREQGDDYVVFEMQAESDGWVALAFSDDSLMVSE